MINESPPFRVRYAETDAQAVAYYGAYFPWQEIGEILLLDRLGLNVPHLDKHGKALTVAESYVRYRRPARYDDLLVVRTRLAEASRKRFLLENEIVRVEDGQILAVGRLSDVFINPATEKVVALPEVLLDTADKVVQSISATEKAEALTDGPPPGAPMHTIELTVRYSETDAQGVAYFGSHYEWFEAGRNELLRELGVPYRHLEQQGIQLPVAEAYCRYLGRIRACETFQVTTWVQDVGRARVTLGNRITLGDRDIAEGFTLHACTNDAGRPQGLSDELAEAVASHA
ncbi:acyl-CoA thioesterase [bacterium]|nr:acyl-CoA thioesterase [bacterium]